MPTNTIASNNFTLNNVDLTTTRSNTTITLPYSTTAETIMWDINNNNWGTVEAGNWAKKNTFVINTLKEDPFAQCETEEEIEYVEHKIKEQIYKMRDNALQRIKENA